jgi:hypothetical protein
LKKIILYLVLFLSAFTIKAQVNDPVQISAQLVPPYSTVVNDYYSADKLKIMLLNRDVSRPSVTVRLRMTIESQSVKIRTREDMAASFQTFNLSNGSPYFVAANELASYFNADNLDFTGALSQQQYVETGKLPEGLYSFCFEAVEVNTGLVVSRKTCGFAWMTLSDPPLLNMPANNNDVSAISPQNVIFNWTPRHTSSPNAAFQVNYELSIVEIREENVTPEQAFLIFDPIFRDKTDVTTFLVDDQKLQLQKGKRYAWRVKAISSSGDGAFRNNGYSEIFSFIYKFDCPDANEIKSEPTGKRARITWKGDPKHLEFKVQYREKDVPNAEWFSVTTSTNSVSVSDLKPNTSYEYQVGPACEYGNFIFKDIYQFQTKDSTVTTVPNCGDSTQIPTTVSTSNLISTLTPGASFNAGDFTIFTTSVTGASTFSGNGYTQVPWLANIKIAVKFTNVQINTNNQLVSGLVETEYDPSGAGISDVDNFFNGGAEFGSIKTGIETATFSPAFPIGPISNINITLSSTYNTTTGIGLVTIKITPENGGTDQTFTTNSLPVTIKDSKGNMYVVDKSGIVKNIGKAGGSQIIGSTDLKNIKSDIGNVKFVAYPTKQIFGLDEYKPIYQKNNYWASKYEKLGNDYYASAKAISAGTVDYLKAVVTLNDNSLSTDSVKFISGKGTIYEAIKLSANEYEIAIIGAPEGDGIEVYAVINKLGSSYNLGKVLVASYPRKEYQVKIVPVNGTQFDINTIKTQLDATYNPINVFFTVTADSDFSNSSWDLNSNGNLDFEQTGLLSNYSNEMKLLQKAYKSARGVTSGTRYLFVVSQVSNLSTIRGEMPRGGMFGYLFGNNAANFPRTAAHEIGHGIGLLKHTFDGNSFVEGDLPFNIMDYGSGTSLSKFQWDLWHDPALVISVFDGDDDALENISTSISADFSGIRNYVTPSGTPITLPVGATIKFNKWADYDQIPNGALYWFETNGKQYAASLDYWRLRVSGGALAISVDNKFGGYYEVKNGVIDLSKPYNFSTSDYPVPVDNKVKVIVLYENTFTQDGTCKLERYVSDLRIAQATLTTVNNSNKTELEETISNLERPLTGVQTENIECPYPYSGVNAGNAIDIYFEKRGKLLQKWFKNKIKSTVTVYLYDCNKKTVGYTITNSEAKKITDENQSTQLLNQYENGSFSTDIAIKGCIGSDGLWKYDIKFNNNSLHPNNPKIQAALNDIITEIKNQANDEVKDKKAYNRYSKDAPEVYPTGDGEQFKKEDMELMRALAAIYDVGKNIINEGQMPESIWDRGERSTPAELDTSKKSEYNKSPFNMPSVLGGGTDQFIDDATGTIQLVKTGYEFIRHPKKTFTGIWNSVKTLNKDKLKQILGGVTGITEYEAGGDRAKHQAGKHSVQAAMILFTGLKTLSQNGADAIEQSGQHMDDLQKFMPDGGTENNVSRTFKNAAENNHELKTIDENRLLTKNVENGEESLVMVEKNGAQTDVYKMDKSEFVDANGNHLDDAAIHQKMIDDVKEVDKPKTPKPKENDFDVFETEAGNSGDWNKVLNNPEPKKVYYVKNNGIQPHKYTTDMSGRVTKVEGELKLSNRDRNGYQQSAKCKKVKDGLPDDQGGHLIGSRFDGAGEQINLLPMKSNLNLSAWKNMENTWADAIRQGKKVNVDIRPVYVGISKRPIAFEVRTLIDGISQPFQTFNN